MSGATLRLDTARAPSGSSRLLELVVIATVVIAYGALLTTGKFNLFFERKYYDFTFNSMLDHMLRGRFDVDPAAVRDEGYIRDGLVYSYWGIFCALLRLPLLLIPNGLRLDVTNLSCWVGAGVAGAAKIHGLFWLRRNTPQIETAGWLFVCLLAYFAFGGALVANLEPSVYAEPIFWAYALAAMFVVASVQGFCLGVFSTPRLCFLALTAGLCLLARSSTGFGLYGTLAVLLLVRWVALLRVRGVSAIFASALIAPALVACLFVVITGIVNAYRWGSPFTTQDLTAYIMLRENAETAGVIARHGMMNVARVPWALLYYFVPIWVLPGPDGTTIFSAVDYDLFALVEMPPSSLLLTDLLPIALGFLLLRELLRRHPQLPRWTTLAFVAALLLPVAVVLLYWAVTNRYRIEFSPALDAIAMLAFSVPRLQHSLTSTRPRRVLLACATLVSIGATMVTLILYRVGWHGDAHVALRSGLKAYYQSRYRYLAKTIGIDLPFSRQR